MSLFDTFTGDSLLGLGLLLLMWSTLTASALFAILSLCASAALALHHISASTCLSRRRKALLGLMVGAFVSQRALEIGIATLRRSNSGTDVWSARMLQKLMALADAPPDDTSNP